MSEEIKDLNKEVDKLEEAAKKYASKDTVISIGGYEFTPAKLMVAFTIVSSTLGGLYGAFEVYKDYQSMKKKIAEYVSPDLTEVYKKLEVIQTDSAKTAEYTRDIKNDLKNDIRRVEGVVESVERGSKQAQRETEQAVQALRNESRATTKEVEQHMKEVSRETQTAIKQLQREVDGKIQKALDNPLAGK
jgi:cell division septum initiation protein DivIVA